MSRDPPGVISIYRTDSLLRPNQKCYNNTWSGIDKARLECAKVENSSPGCTYGFLLMLVGAENLLWQGSNLRYREECETKSNPQFFLISVDLPYIVGGGCFALSKEGKQHLPKVFLCDA